LKFSFHPFRLECTYPFKISRSSYTGYEIFFVYLKLNEFLGRGEIAPSPRYGESYLHCLNILKAFPNHIPQSDNFQTFKDFCEPYVNGIHSVEAGLSMAYWDLHGKQKGKSVNEIFNCESSINHNTSYTIAMGELNLLPEKIKEATPYKTLKVKCGSKQDKANITAIRNITDKTIRVDANEGWTFDEALFMCHWLEGKNVDLIEQPLKVDSLPLMKELKNESHIPLIADENCVQFRDIESCVEAFHGINIKLMKCGGLEEVSKMINGAKEFGLKIMLGCMVESSIGITAMSQFASSADYLDLDGNLLINNDPYKGVTIKNGIPVLPDDNGLGLSLNSEGKAKGLL
jgi:L-alanine-DL-glutamate epimerase-like enolase superfamily enzyme